MSQNSDEIDPEEFLQNLMQKIPGRQLLHELKQPNILKLAGVTTIATILIYYVGGWLISFWSPGPTVTQTNHVQIFDVMKSLEFYKYQHGEFPDGPPGTPPADAWTTLLEESTSSDGTTIPPLIADIPRDSWGNALHYEYPNTKISASNRPAVWSSGPDGINDHGNNDDITSWKSSPAE